MELEITLGKYEDYQLFGPILKCLEGNPPASCKQRAFVSLILPIFEKDGGRMIYRGNIFIQRRFASKILKMAHGSNTYGHFGFSKAISRFENYHWRPKGRDVKRYVQGCLTFQQMKDKSGKKLTDPTFVEVRDRGWGSLATYFIVAPPKTKMSFYSITTWVYRLSRIFHFIPLNISDTSVHVAERFYPHVFQNYGIPETIV